MTVDDLTLAQKETLLRLPERFRPEDIDCLWLFPPHVVKTRESGFVVLSLMPESPGDSALRKRTLVTFRYEAEQVKGKIIREERVTEEGSAPPERIRRVIAGVLARTAAESADPIVEEIDGDPERWTSFLRRFGLAA